MAATLSLFRPSDLRTTRKETPTVAEPQLFYAPPYATPEEDTFAWALVRSMKATAGLRQQVQVDDVTYNFVIEHGGRRTGIRIADETSHASVEDPHGIDVCYVLRASDVRERLEDIIYVMALLDPSLFDTASRVRARRESSEHLAIEFSGDRMSHITLRYEAPEPLVEIEGEWLVLDPDAASLETEVIRLQAS